MFQKAEKRQTRIRIAIAGPSGSGKTYSSLLIAKGLADSWEKIGIIDTERGSSQLYADLGPFLVNVLEPPFTPARYIQAIKAAEEAGLEVLVIDSLSHAWAGEGGVLDIHGQSADKAKNSFTAWREVTPLHNRLVDTILQSKCHVIVTLRTKTEYVIDENGKKIRKVGLQPIQRDGLEYEFTIFGDLSPNHLLNISKDRTGLFQDQSLVPDEKMGQKIKNYFANILEKPASEVVQSESQVTVSSQTVSDSPVQKEFSVVLLSLPEEGFAPAIDVITDSELVLNFQKINCKNLKTGQVYHVKGAVDGKEVKVENIRSAASNEEPGVKKLQVTALMDPVQTNAVATDGTSLDTFAINAVDPQGNQIFLAGACLRDVREGKTYEVSLLENKQVPNRNGEGFTVVYIIQDIAEVLVS